MHFYIYKNSCFLKREQPFLYLSNNLIYRQTIRKFALSQAN